MAGIAQAKGLDVVWTGYPPTRIDLVKEVPGGNFETSWSRCVELDVAGQGLNLMGRECLITLKRASDRTQDLADAEALELPLPKPQSTLGDSELGKCPSLPLKRVIL